LPGTADEAKALKAMLPGASVVTESRATESALKEITPPAILHIATHGFFLEDVFISSSQTSSRGLIIRGDQPNEPFAPEMVIGNPLLRSGLAMAGANLHRSDGDDGILTALEVAGLNLWGTKLVVLSACDTGVGSVRNGEGIYGLRRALVLAGSETQVMSLWPVNDEGTRDLMIGYYKGLQAGQGRGEALRQIQLSMLKSNDRKHPYYWASFIQSGEWANLEGKR
jgi:CHAT domain-containing protein